MGTYADYSEWLKQGDNLAKEDEAWLRDHTQPREEVAKIVRDTLDEWNLHSVLEFGCGTGWLGNAICAQYTGVDRNPECVAIADERRRNPQAVYFKGDIREWVPQDLAVVDLVVSFSFLKHFGLHEWESVFQKFLSFGEFAIFTLQTTDGEDEEDGTEYHHVWIGPKTLKEALKDHEILHTEVRWNDPNSDKQDILFVVKRKDA